MKLYGLIGYPLGHSFSANFFAEKFAREGIDARYLNFEIPDIGDLMELLAEYPELEGFNVTIPYKQQILPYLQTLSPQAQAIGAVNVVSVEHTAAGPVLHGHNTDCPGFARTLAPLLPQEAVSALVLGTGGAAKAVLTALSQLGVAAKTVSRTPAAGRLTYDDLTAEVMAAHRVVVNCTPLGMWPNVDSAPAIPYDEITTAHVCYDVVYNPEETEFMRRARAKGATVSNGLAMLHMQALLAWQIWNTQI